MIKNICAFTGHRPKSFPWKYDETAPECVALKKVLAEQIKALTDRGVTGFLSGMALGTDLWTAQIVLDLREKNPALKLYCALPCEGQEKKWPADKQALYHSILKQADDIHWESKSYTPDCMLNRNRYMVDHASVLLAVYNGVRRSGTGATVNYARKMGLEIIVIDPATLEITHEDSAPDLRL